MLRQLGLLSLLFAFFAASAARAQGPQAMELPDSMVGTVDSVFADFDNTRSPGCVLGVAEEGEPVLTRGYGMANLDYGVPLAPESVFYLASVSKQFVAAAVALAAEQDYLSLSDDIRTHVPELPDYGETITVRHLIHHTSGLRDYLSLMPLAGMRSRDVHPKEEILDLIVRQQELNFAPGERYLYSNTGYFLLAEIIERAPGQTLRAFTTEHLFEPLGMEDTHFHDDAYHIQKNRAISYRPDEEEGFRISFLANFDQVGSGGLYSTVEDLYRWDEAFSGERSVGAPGFIDRLHTRGVLANGDTLDYAFGLDIGGHRGLSTVGHGGSMMGYKTAFLRFPEEHFSVITLCNRADAEPTDLAREVAEVFLSERMGRPEEPPAAADATDVPEEELEQVTGTYRLEDGPYRRIELREGELFYVQEGGDAHPLVPLDDDRFQVLESSDEMILEERPSEREGMKRFQLYENGEPEEVLVEYTPWEPTAEELEAFAGRYYSEEVEASYTLVLEADELVARHDRLLVARHDRLREDVSLTPKEKNHFLGSYPFQYVRFERGGEGPVSGFFVSNSRARGIWFEKEE